MHRNVIAICCLLTTFNCQATPVTVTATPTRMQAINLGDAVAGAILIDDRQIDLPSGSWRAIAKVRTDYDRLTVLNILLAKYDGDQLVEMLRIITPEKSLWSSVAQTQFHVGWDTDPCGTVKGAYFTDSLGGNISVPECLYVKPIIGFGRAPGAYWQMAFQRMHSAGVKYPSTLITTDYSYYTTRGFVRLTAWLNPKTMALPEDQADNTTTSQWSSKNLRGEYAEYISRVKSWSYTLADVVKDSYNHKAARLPEYPFTGAPSTTQPQ